MVKSFKTNLLTWLKTKTYIKTEIDTKLQNKSDINHTHDISDLYDNFDMISGIQDELNEKADKSVVTTSVNGLMSKEDKVKLDGIATEANKTVVDSSLSSSSTNPVQNKVVNSALSGKANSSHSHSISNITNLQSALDSKSATGHTHDDLYYTEAEIDTKLDNKADSSHSHSINDVTGLSTSLDGKMSNDYSESTIESNFFAHKIGNIVIVTWWNETLPTTQNSWVDWKTLPYESCNTQPIWVNGDGIGCEARVRVPPNSNKLQVFITGGTGSIRPGMIVYPTNN